MKNFSQRIGKKPIRNMIQKESMDDRLRNSLWNSLEINYWMVIEEQEEYNSLKTINSDFYYLLINIWIDFFGYTIDKMPASFSKYKVVIRRFFFEAKWYQVYDLIEFVPNNFQIDYYSDKDEEFFKYCNHVLEKELSAYRFVNGLLSPITSEEELKSIGESLQVSDKFKPVAIHLESALKYFSNRQAPDYRNSIKESISAIESYCSILTGETTLGKALKKVKNHQEIHPALEKAFAKLYGYTSDGNGIRHALLEEDNLRQEDAKFMLVACSAFINYLKEKNININGR